MTKHNSTNNVTESDVEIAVHWLADAFEPAVIEPADRRRRGLRHLDRGRRQRDYQATAGIQTFPLASS